MASAATPIGVFPVPRENVATRWPRTVFVTCLVIAALAAVGTTRLKNEEDLLVFLPTSDPDVRLFQDVSRRFGSLRVAIVGVEAPAGDDVFSPASLGKIERATHAIKNVRGVDLILSMTEVSDIIAGPLGATQVDLVPSLPTNAAESRALREKILSREFAVGNFVSPDGRGALILASIRRTAPADRRRRRRCRRAGWRGAPPPSRRGRRPAGLWYCRSGWPG